MFFAFLTKNKKVKCPNVPPPKNGGKVGVPHVQKVDMAATGGMVIGCVCFRGGELMGMGIHAFDSM